MTTTRGQVMMELCSETTLRLSKCTIQTSILEVWRSEGCKVVIDCAVGTCQVDVCNGLTLAYSSRGHLGSLVQAGMNDLDVQFEDAPGDSFKTGLTQLRAQHPEEPINDDTDQFITRIVNGVLLTERILRLANDFPTTLREKKIFDEEAQRKADAIEGIAEKMIGASMLGSAEAAALKQESAKQRDQGAKESDVSPEARGKYRKNMGNEAFKQGDHKQAAVFYTESILIYDKDPAVFSNRAQCFLKMGQHDKALQDAEACIALDDKFVKGYFRKGLAAIALDRFEEGALAMAKVLDLEPNNKDAQASLQMAQIKAHRARMAQNK
jgi:tetratricopeptide (TPR) repeat protein